MCVSEGILSPSQFSYPILLRGLSASQLLTRLLFSVAGLLGEGGGCRINGRSRLRGQSAWDPFSFCSPSLSARMAVGPCRGAALWARSEMCFVEAANSW